MSSRLSRCSREMGNGVYETEIFCYPDIVVHEPGMKTFDERQKVMPSENKYNQVGMTTQHQCYTYIHTL